jgi:hypothetical protein
MTRLLSQGLLVLKERFRKLALQSVTDEGPSQRWLVVNLAADTSDSASIEEHHAQQQLAELAAVPLHALVEGRARERRQPRWRGQLETGLNEVRGAEDYR